MAKAGKESYSVMDQLQRNWGWVTGMGVLFLILGCIGLSMVVGLTLVSMIFFSILLFIAGFTHFIDVFTHRTWRGILWQAFIAVLYIVAAVVVLDDPFLVSALLTALLAGVLIVLGITRIMMAFSLREEQSWFWLFLAGITSLVLGILILAHWPMSGLWIIGLFIAIEMIVTGWTYIFIGFSLRKAQRVL